MAPKIEAHVLVYSLTFGLTTAIAYGLSKAYAKPQAELDAELRAKYPELIKRSQDQKVHMQAFFDKVRRTDWSQFPFILTSSIYFNFEMFYLIVIVNKLDERSE